MEKPNNNIADLLRVVLEETVEVWEQVHLPKGTKLWKLNAAYEAAHEQWSVEKEWCENLVKSKNVLRQGTAFFLVCIGLSFLLMQHSLVYIWGISFFVLIASPVAYILDRNARLLEPDCRKRVAECWEKCQFLATDLVRFREAVDRFDLQRSDPEAGIAIKPDSLRPNLVEENLIKGAGIILRIEKELEERAVGEQGGSAEAKKLPGDLEKKKRNFEDLRKAALAFPFAIRTKKTIFDIANASL